MKSIYICPETKKPLRERDDGLLRDDGDMYPFIKGGGDVSIPNFLAAQEHGEAAKQSLTMYDQNTSAEVYRNFLDWLFHTFNENESSFRTNLIARLKLQKGNRVLITGCGLGDDIQAAIDAIGSDGEVYANDLAAQMVVAASHHYYTLHQATPKNIFFFCM